MKLKYEFEMLELDDHIVAVIVDDSPEGFHGIIKLNDSAAEIFNLLQNENTEEDIVKQLMKKHHNTEDELKSFVHDLVRTLSSEGVIINNADNC